MNVSLKFIFGNPHIARCLEKSVYPGVSVLRDWVDQCPYQSWAKRELSDPTVFLHCRVSAWVVLHHAVF